MTRFAIGQTVVTKEPVISVDAGLAVGSHRFRLVVSDDSGLASKPVEVVVQVSPTTQPTTEPTVQPIPRPTPRPIVPQTGIATAKLPRRGPR
jgi:hypothetical protein